MVPTEAGQSVPMSGTKRKILSCSRPPLFCEVSFSPQRFITTQSPTFPALPICPYAPFLGFKQTHTHTQRPRGYPLAPKGDYTTCLLNARWPLVSSCLCNRQPEHSPNPLLQSRGLLPASPGPACPLYRKAVTPALPSSHEAIQLPPKCNANCEEPGTNARWSSPGHWRQDS